MKVLSLFDGISCGMVALERAGIPVEEYYAYEIDKDAIAISKKNYPQIIQCGNVTTEDFSKYEDKIDLLIGGSPCQGFSFIGKRLNFDDSRSKLFFEYVRALKEVKPKYFLLENVKMKNEWQEIISNELGVKPILINSALVSAQHRQRLYWTNIPNVTIPENKNILLKDILENVEFDGLFGKIIPSVKKNVERQYSDIISTEKEMLSLDCTSGWADNQIGIKKAPTIRAYKRCCVVKTPDNKVREITITEAEKLQTLPVDYTSGKSEHIRYKAIGNGWTVDVIAHILRGIKK